MSASASSSIPTSDSMSLVEQIRHWVLRRVWYVLSPMSLVVTVAPTMCMHILATISKPSMKRLEYRQLFANGRRYQIGLQSENSFYIMTTHKLIWSQRRRTRSSAILVGQFMRDSEDAPITTIKFRAHIKATYLLDVIPLPLFTTSLIIFMPWNPFVIAILTVALFAFSWFGHRYNAALEAHHMVFFIQKALEEHIFKSELLSSQGSAEVVYKQEADFAREWERFVENQKRPNA